MWCPFGSFFNANYVLCFSVVASSGNCYNLYHLGTLSSKLWKINELHSGCALSCGFWNIKLKDSPAVAGVSLYLIMVLIFPCAGGALYQ